MNRIYQREGESGCEYSLPDYMGDVKKILSVNAIAIPSGKFAGDESVEFSGIVSYDVLYSDADGKLTRILTSSDYDIAVPSGDGYVGSMADVSVANLSVRLTGPRKLILKASLSASVRVISESSISCSGSAFEGGMSPELLSEAISEESVIFGEMPEREYAEVAEHIAAVTADELEIIATSGAVRITESEAVDGGVLVKGELIITAIVRTDEQPPFAIKKVIPFEETVNLEGMQPDMQVAADGYLSSVSCGVSEDADGCNITVNAIAELSAVAAANRESELITDAYLKNRDTSGQYEEYTYSELLCMKTAEESFVLTVPRVDISCENIRDVLTVNAEARSLVKKIEKNQLVLEGEALVSGVACEINSEEKVSYIPVKFTSPFAINVNSSCQIPENAAIDCKFFVVSATPELDGDRLNVKCLAKIFYRITEPHTVRRMTECSIVGDTEYSSRRSSFTVYYPEKGESLFEIAKRFHTTSEKIAVDNKLAEPTLASADVASAGIKKLIIR